MTSWPRSNLRHMNDISQGTVSQILLKIEVFSQLLNVCAEEAARTSNGMLFNIDGAAKASGINLSS